TELLAHYRFRRAGGRRNREVLGTPSYRGEGILMTVTAERPAEAVDTAAAEDQRTRNALGVMRLIVGVLLVAGVSMAFHKGGATLVVAVIMGMIMFHEFGHFITAKWAGMKVTDFFVGFGPVLWSTQRGETRYGVRALPVGGYVKVIGMNNLEEVDPADESR